MTDHLRRDLAPIGDAAWTVIEDEVKGRLAGSLAGRKLVDFEGPLGWDHSSTNLGRVQPIVAIAEGLTAAQRSVLALVEVRAPFTLSISELDNVDRGAADVDLEALETATLALAQAENQAVFHGYPAAGITGIVPASSHQPIAPDSGYPAAVAHGVEELRKNGINGPYGLALAPALYTEVVETTESGYPLVDHLRRLLGGPVVWAPGVSGGVLVSQRGGDFVFECGQDIAIGYTGHDADTVSLYLEESFTFRVLERDAAVALTGPFLPDVI